MAKENGEIFPREWLNYLRPDIKRGNITHDEEELIIRIHKLLGNRWSLIAGWFPCRTDNEIKNYWNTNIGKKIQTGGSLEDFAREKKERMEAKKVFGGSPCLSSSLLRVQAQRICSLSYTNKPILRTIHHDLHLAAFDSKSHLFSYSPSSPHIKTTLSHKTHIFLHHLVASMEQVEETYIMVKPDSVQRGLVGQIISRFEKKGFKLIGFKLFQCPKELAEAWEGVGVVSLACKLIASTDPLQGDLAVQIGRNLIHGSDSHENGKREIGW